jgi:eukaryotic-like serine/threonine-protein kinase
MVTPAEGETLSNLYQLGQVIGTGGMGVVFRARQLNVSRDVAVKIMHSHLSKDETAIRRFQNEVRIISQLRHPNTLRLYDCQLDDGGHLFIVTELLSGRPLSEEIQRNGALDVARVIRVIDSVCRSLSEAHAAGIVHRDLKPENIFIDRVGTEDVVKVLDFGVAKLLEARDAVTQPGAICGTPEYMAPEQIKAEPVDHRADIYALGAVAHEMLTGLPPFRGDHSFDVFHLQLSEPPPRIERPIPPALRALVHAMLEKDPEKRPQSVEEIRLLLPDPDKTSDTTALIEITIDHEATERAPIPAQAPRAARRLLLGACLAAAIAIVTLGWLAADEPPPPEAPVEIAEPPRAIEPQRQVVEPEQKPAAPPRFTEEKRGVEPSRAKPKLKKKPRVKKRDRVEKPAGNRWDKPQDVDL